MTARSLFPLALAGTLLSSCIYYTNPVPEMPYRPYSPNSAAAQAEAHANNAAYLMGGRTGDIWNTTRNAPNAPQPPSKAQKR